jgi:hypothetical protein
MDADEKVARHQHPVEHTTMVIAGLATVQVFEDIAVGGVPFVGDPMPMRAQDLPRVLPANADHEITAHEDGTIVLNMIAAGSVDGGQTGGVAHADGTVRPHEAA